MTDEPLQIDLFTGEAGEKPKSGPADHSHVLLKDRPKYPLTRGMAAPEGSGPPHKTCTDCMYYGRVTVETPKPRGTMPIEASPACAIYAKRTGKPVQARLAGHLACSCFKEGETPRAGWIIHEDGRGPFPVTVRSR